MMIHSRHIRWDWQQFVDWQQKSVRTMCGVTTRRNLAGIPGITRQSQIIDIKDKQYWGWCERCVGIVYRAVMQMDEEVIRGTLEFKEVVRNLYLDALDVIEPQYRAAVERELRRRGRLPAILPGKPRLSN